ncbi:rho GTPase-activating protein 20-like [Elephas maximus indicus]|uniref:rho GTPase-activating protein 20-like n=1 Tax=Elephas maximus indicus TaxID=99487 RepID=UPI002116BE97|nr:rho GTPase-activating protein 20-like [Elephas maximus indicus]
MQPPYGLAIAHLGIYHTKICTQMFIAALFVITKYRKRSRCPSANECLKHAILWFAVCCRKTPSTEVDTHNERTTLPEGPNRTLLIHGPVEFKRGWRRQKRHLFLFSDLLLVSNSKYRKTFKIKDKIPLNTMWMTDCDDTNAKRSLVLGWPTVNFTATFSSSEQKEQWRSSLRRYIDLAKEKDHPKSIPLKIFTEDIENCAYRKSLTVTNSDTTNDIIDKSLPMLGITGSKSDYQLRVSSGKKEAPFPLIGHEHPYGIIMSHLQATALLPHRLRGSISPSTLQESVLLEQPFPEMGGPFVLKPRRPLRSQEQKNAGQKTGEKKWPMVNWAFRRNPSTCQDNVCRALPSPEPGKLFGVSLKDVCPSDDLPTPLRDMLFFLNQKGPLTEGIFRISASVRACGALKQKLNSGEKVNWEDESVLVVASVLKDFFRNIQESVFSSGLYYQWLTVIDEGNEEEKITGIQRLLDQLPKANVVLLRYLFGALHNIEQHSASNQMTAYNLSVCIAPSILWSSTSCSPGLENELTKKISLVQFVIKNCLNIFGKDITSLLEESSMITTMSCDCSEKASEVTTEQPLESKPIRVILIYRKRQLRDSAQAPSDVDQPPVTIF